LKLKAVLYSKHKYGLSKLMAEQSLTSVKCGMKE